MKFGNLVEICLWPHLAVKGLKVRLWCDVIDSVPIYDISKQTFFTFYLSIVGKKKSGLNVLNFHVACMYMSVRIQGFI